MIEQAGHVSLRVYPSMVNEHITVVRHLSQRTSMAVPMAVEDQMALQLHDSHKITVLHGGQTEQ